MTAPVIERPACLDAALHLATALGLPVLPLAAGTKVPHRGFVGGVHAATTDEAVIRQWFEQRPDANVAIATGGPLLVLDVDPRHGGDESLDDLQAKHGRLPDTLTSKTPRGGLHSYLLVDEGLTFKKSIAPGLDIQAAGRYVVAPPSRTDAGAYNWLDFEGEPTLEMIAPAPRWLIELAVVESIDAPATVQGAGMGPEQREEVISALEHLDPDGYEDWYRVGMALHSTGDREAFGIWVQWSKRSPKFKMQEHVSKWKSFGRYSGEPTTVRAIFAQAQANGWQNPLKGSTSSTFKQAQPKLFTPGNFATADEIANRPPPKWIVKGMLPDRAIGEIYGDPSCGKTFLATRLAQCVSEGRDFFGRKTDQGRVIYISAEGSMQNRIKAIIEHESLARPALPELFFYEGAVNMLGDPYAGELIKLLREKHEDGRPIRMVILDTLNRTMGGGDENSSVDMGKFINGCEGIRDAFDCLVLIIHHSGKDATKGSRGHSSLKAADDVQISVRVDRSGIRVATIEKSRDGIVGEEIPFKLQPVQVGEDEDGDPITSCVVLPADGAAPRPAPKARPTGRNQRAVFEELEKLISDQGRPSGSGTSAIPAGVRYVGVKDIESRAAHRLLTDSKHKAARIREALEGLQAGGFVGICDPYIWINR